MMASRRTEFWKDLQAAKLLVKQAEQESDLRREMFYAARPGNADVEYSPTKSSDRSNPRTAAVEYWQEQQVLRVSWGDGGTPYLYYQVTPDEMTRLVRAPSPGRFINGNLNSHAYGPDAGS